MIAAMACLLSIATVFSYMLYVRCRHLSNERYEYAIQQDPNDILGQ